MGEWLSSGQLMNLSSGDFSPTHFPLKFENVNFGKMTIEHLLVHTQQPTVSFSGQLAKKNFMGEWLSSGQLMNLCSGDFSPTHFP